MVDSLPTSKEDNTVARDYTVIEIPLTWSQASALEKSVQNALNTGVLDVKIVDSKDGTYKLAVGEQSYQQWGAIVKNEFEKANLAPAEVGTVNIPARSAKGFDYNVGKREVDTHNAQFNAVTNELRAVRTRRVEAQENLIKNGTAEEKQQYKTIKELESKQPGMDLSGLAGNSPLVKARLEAEREELRVEQKLKTVQDNSVKLTNDVMDDRFNEMTKSVRNGKVTDVRAQAIQDRKETAVDDIIGARSEAITRADNQDRQLPEVAAMVQERIAQGKVVTSEQAKGAAAELETAKNNLKENNTEATRQAFAAATAKVTDMAQQLRDSVTRYVEDNKQLDIPNKKAMFDKPGVEKMGDLEQASPATVTPIKQEVADKVEPYINQPSTVTYTPVDTSVGQATGAAAAPGTAAAGQDPALAGGQPRPGLRVGKLNETNSIKYQEVLDHHARVSHPSNSVTWNRRGHIDVNGNGVFKITPSAGDAKIRSNITIDKMDRSDVVQFDIAHLNNNQTITRSPGGDGKIMITAREGDALGVMDTANGVRLKVGDKTITLNGVNRSDIQIGTGYDGYVYSKVASLDSWVNTLGPSNLAQVDAPQAGAGRTNAGAVGSCQAASTSPQQTGEVIGSIKTKDGTRVYVREGRDGQWDVPKNAIGNGQGTMRYEGKFKGNPDIRISVTDGHVTAPTIGGAAGPARTQPNR